MGDNSGGRGGGSIEAQRPVAQADSIESAVREPPLFVVGCPRSGTTLVQTMLDSHPRLSVTYEADFFIDIPLGLRSFMTDSAEALRLAEGHPFFYAHNFDAGTARAVCRELGITDAPGAMRALGALQALAQGKRRWGNKTPKALLHVAELAVIYPDAQFIHVIRDGMESASSQARVSGRSLVQGVLLWRTGMRVGRRAGALLGPHRYLEVRLEEVLAAPEEQLRRMCAFLGEEFDPSMVDFYKSARQRIPAAGLRIHPRLGEAPRPSSGNGDSSAAGVTQRAAAALVDAERVELGYLPAASCGRIQRIMYVVIGYSLLLISLRESWRDLFRYLGRCRGARRATRRAARQPARPLSQGGTLPYRGTRPVLSKALDER